MEKVPGTGLLSDQGIVHGHEVAIDEAKHLKRGTGKYAHVVLIPQPSDDPADPYASHRSSLMIGRVRGLIDWLGVGIVV